MRWTLVAVGALISAAAWGEDEKKEPAKEAPKAEAPKTEAAQPAEGGGGEWSVIDAKLGTGVENMEAVGEATTFKADSKVVCWSKIQGKEGGKITHAWYKGSEKYDDIGLDIPYATMRTFSRKTIPADGAGDWHVDIVGPDGTVLKTLAFKIE